MSEITPNVNFFITKNPIASVKHEILKRYLDAYLPIMYHNNYANYDTIVYVDGFAGSGEYEDGKEGSPVLALRAALCHKKLKNGNGPKIELIFIELDEARWRKLKHVLNETLRSCQEKKEVVNENVEFNVMQGTFDSQMRIILENNITAVETPLLVFTDPFGFSGDLIPMELMRKIFDLPKSELFINVMDGFANRFFNADHAARAINKLMGVENAEWRDAVFSAGNASNKSPAAALARREAFINFYIEQLGAGYECFSLKFGMKNENNRHKYHLVFFTHHQKGLEKMKKSMAKQSLENDQFIFSEFLRDKGHVKDDSVRWEGAKELILDNFEGQNSVSGIMIKQFIWTETIYIWNFVKQARKDFQEYILTPNRKFEEVVFDFQQYINTED